MTYEKWRAAAELLLKPGAMSERRYYSGGGQPILWRPAEPASADL